ncbi:cytochrome c family protein [Duganella sp. LX20W]|uniref:Cytochrome c family protein n=1 Tax=Rugamonas brunnea TaxID=2758569 RepID=A0A7W2EPU0_9BURK|nr:cytochrome c family protein [Rugamonas brunnea]MBA5636421.1 cytochrome c family protein [Rugamonas brunnea]
MSRSASHSVRCALAAAALCALAPARAGGDVAAGKAAFRKCASCHQVGPSARGGFGPQLNAVIGRRAASTTDYTYSDAMRRSGIVWNEQTLGAFLRGPGDVVPGTRMRFWGISDAQQIADLLAYLRTQR